MHTVLDLDLDAFSSPPVYCPQTSDRPSDSNHVSASVSDLRHFLENQCGLIRDRPIPGCEFAEHCEAFFVWRRWIDQGLLTPPFAIVHVDAHADMGLGDSGFVYLLSELLALPLGQRRDPRRGDDAMNPANYLMFALANRWAAQLTYVYPVRHPWAANWLARPNGLSYKRNPGPGDLMDLHFRDGDKDSGFIELCQYSAETLDSARSARHPSPAIRKEPQVPFTALPIPEFAFAGFSHMVVARSPTYAPASADRLLPTIREYFVKA